MTETGPRISRAKDPAIVKRAQKYSKVVYVVGFTLAGIIAIIGIIAIVYSIFSPTRYHSSSEESAEEKTAANLKKKNGVWQITAGPVHFTECGQEERVALPSDGQRVSVTFPQGCNAHYSKVVPGGNESDAELALIAVRANRDDTLTWRHGFLPDRGVIVNEYFSLAERLAKQGQRLQVHTLEFRSLEGSDSTVHVHVKAIPWVALTRG
jgi:hypothetical protein